MSPGQARAELPAVWAEALGKVLEAMTGAATPIEWRAMDGGLPAAPEGESRTWWADGVSIVPGPSVWIGAPGGTWSAFGTWMLSTLGVDEAGEEDIRSTCRDVVAQVASAFATELGGRLGQPVNSLGVSPAEGPAENAFLVTLEITIPADSSKLVFAVGFHPSLGGQPGGEAAEPSASPEASDTNSAGLAEPIAELYFPVYARLGLAPVQLGQVFKWTVGSVVEVGRRITDPIDLVVGGRMVARGQVVVSNGHYGARITSIERDLEAEVF